MSKLKVEEYCSTIQSTTHHVKFLNTEMVTGDGGNQSTGLGQAHKWQDETD